MTYSEAMANCYGYLTAMKDFGFLNEEQKTNEVNNMSYRFLNMQKTSLHRQENRNMNKLKNMLLGTSPIWLPIASITIIGYVLKFLNWQVTTT